MRQYVAKLSLVLVGGCSLLFNPDLIDKAPPDGPSVDVEVRADASLADLQIIDVNPKSILEGTGSGGSRKGIVVLRGHNFIASANLAVSLAPTTAGSLTLDSFEASGNGDYLAIEVTAPVVTTCNEGTTDTIVVKVEQDDGVGGRVAKETGELVVTCLDELTTAPTTTTGLHAIYSVIDIAGNVNFPAAVADKALLRSASTISIGTIDASATGQEPGPGGGSGGAISMPGTGLQPGTGAGPLSGAGGGGAGFVVAGSGGAGGNPGVGGGMTGDVWISSYATNASSGGGGGAAAVGLIGGGPGGGGGGTLELTALGDISVGAITANGAPGTNAGAGGVGGQGAGGVVVIRTAGTLAGATVSVANGGTGAASSSGRVRVDAAKGSYPAGAQKGPMFVDLPTKLAEQVAMVALRGQEGDSSSKVRVFDATGNAVAGMEYTPVFGSSGSATIPATLKAGYNKICAFVGPNPLVTEATNCFELAYLPP